MARIEPDSLMIQSAQLAQGETVQAEFRADKTAYWRAHLIMAIVLGSVAGVVLLVQGNPYPVLGPVGAALAIGIRAAYVASEALAELWLLTNRRLIGPRGIAVPLVQIATARPFLGSVQVVTQSGDKHLIKYIADTTAVAARIRGTA